MSIAEALRTALNGHEKMGLNGQGKTFAPNPANYSFYCPDGVSVEVGPDSRYEGYQQIWDTLDKVAARRVVRRYIGE